MRSCLLCGVGGQGTVLASRIIAAASMNKGLFARTAETIGMAQRGGCVVSHVRVGDSVPSPLIPYSQADVILGFEPGEAVRNLKYLKKDGLVIVCDKIVPPVTASLSGDDYNANTMLDYLKNKVANLIVLDTDKIIRECGSAKALNVALMGALASSGKMNLDIQDIEAALLAKIKPQYIEMNKKALRLGAESI